MPTLSNASDYEDVDDIVAEYEKQDSDGDQLNANRDQVLGSENEESEEANTARRIDPSTSKKHVIRNPIPKLNTERLKGSKGIQTIEKYFEGFKFHGKGNEKLDLDRIMKRMEHWGHRLFPKLEFDDFLEKVEKLGTKKDLQVFIKKYRLDMISADDGTIVQDIEDEENDKDQDEPIDEFDLLIAEQIEKQKQVINQESTAEALFDQIISQTNNKNSQPVQEHSRPPHLSNEVKERIERNRQQAIQRKLARLKAMEDEANKKKLVEAKDTQSEDSSCNVQTPSETQNLENKDFETGSEEANGDHNS